MSIIKIKKRCNPYVQIDKGCLNDPLLSWQAKGLLCYLLSKPEDWKPSVKEIYGHSTNGRDAVYGIIEELTNSGYIVKEAVKEKGRFVRFEYTVYELPVTSPDTASFEQDEPLTEKPEVENDATSPLPGFPDTGFPDTGFPTHNNNIYKKKERNKKERVRLSFDELVEKELATFDEGFHTTWTKYREWVDKQDFEYVGKIRDQLTPRQLHTLLQTNSSKQIISKIMVIENHKNKYTGNKSVYLTISGWLEMYAQ